MQDTLIEAVAGRTQLPFRGVRAAVQLFDGGATVPFVARYRQAQTGGLDEEQLRAVQKAYQYVSDLASRKETVLRTITEQGKLTPELQRKIELCQDATELEDIYLPYKPKRKTKAAEALERGLGPLADLMLTAKTGDLDALVEPFLQGEICTRKEALTGAQYIIAERAAETAEIRAELREKMQRYGVVGVGFKKTDHPEAFKFETYKDANLSVNKLKPHQVLALNRGEKLNILNVSLAIDEASFLERMQRHMGWSDKLVFADAFTDALRLSFSRYLQPSIERDVRRTLTEQAEQHAISVFSQNLRSLLLQAPLLGKVVMGLDPGFASGVKVAVVDATGRYLHGSVIYPTPPRKDLRGAEMEVLKLVERHRVDLIAIGNGTASRETELFVADVIKRNKLETKYLIVSEAGASVYSASEVARREFPDLDATQRGNISIARRVQDPLAELVKIDPKSLGVGLYQHDVDQNMLAAELQAVVESAVNEVGVDVNTASAELLSYVSGLNRRLAESVVQRREQAGPFRSRKDLMAVRGIGEKVFEQCAGFLRIRDGAEPLDNTAIHPESYGTVRQLADKLQTSKDAFAILALKLKQLKAPDEQKLLTDLGLDKPTYKLIADNLAKPGRDPREDVPKPLLRSDVLSLDDLKVGMVLQGTVRNVVDFGAFVDVGLKNDALLHASRLRRPGERGQVNPLERLHVGDVLRVVVDKIETDKQRVGLALAEEE